MGTAGDVGDGVARFGRGATGDDGRGPVPDDPAEGGARLDADRFRARGTLTLKGVARPVEFPFTFVVRPDGAALEGALVLQRGAFGIGQGEWAATNVIGADVKVNFAVKLVPMP